MPRPRAGGLLTGVALLGLAAWLFRFDLAWRTIRHPGLPRFMAICLLSGYVWLTTTAVLVGLKWPQTNGVVYDAALHAFLVGFVFSMIFGHAPVIFPAVLGLPVHFRWTSYLPLVVLHGSVLLRMTSDLANWPTGRSWGAAANAAAVGLFLLNTVLGFVFPPRNRLSLIAGRFESVGGRLTSAYEGHCEQFTADQGNCFELRGRKFSPSAIPW